VAPVHKDLAAVTLAIARTFLGAQPIVWKRPAEWMDAEGHAVAVRRVIIALRMAIA
jgi:hypothetical protein